ncbi:hypothetical protein M1247_14745 [Mycobacterium sp. 21AC1]|uniref:hypothetical protein n=1 Tax=[Mycobacterium] appelbergii TaxID=2939269 RepID=UPI00293916DC|nr:hypothetical protein [Mycobacterium sp. 21AC1]MDV3126178.1 hypothetical protein [Mycobacterium sp. 21AC1]
MYLSAERIAVAEQAIRETFEQTSIAWQAVCHWETGDPAQTLVPNGNLKSPNFESIVSVPVDVELTLAEAISPTPDALIAKVTVGAAKLAGLVDAAVLPKVRAAITAPTSVVHVVDGQPATILDALIKGRVEVEKAGYRAPSCLFTDTLGIQKLNQLLPVGVGFLQSALGAANINALHRADQLEAPVADAHGVLLGRRQRIASGSAMDASPGEEPVDLAVSVPPSLEVVGDTATNTIKLRVRMSYATRVKDVGGLVVFVTP